jgi:hypothetical protein
MRKVCIALAVLLAATTAANSQTRDVRGTVNSVSENEIARARAAISRAGYKPTVLEFAQAGNLFFTATKDGSTYSITVTPSDQIFVSTGLPSSGPA